jgi:hypothetical protein
MESSPTEDDSLSEIVLAAVGQTAFKALLERVGNYIPSGPPLLATVDPFTGR